ncbi:MAG: SulP family inorganic anion transporter, partial [Bacteroidota bacterium]
GQYIPFLVTIAGIVFTDLLVGIALGLAVAILHILWNNYKVPFHFDSKAFENGEPVRIQLSEEVSFLNKAGILHTLNDLPDNSHIIIDATKSKSIHQDVLEIIDDFKVNAASRQITVELLGLDEWTSRKHTNPRHEFGRVVLNESKSE